MNGSKQNLSKDCALDASGSSLSRVTSQSYLRACLQT